MQITSTAQRWCHGRAVTPSKTPSSWLTIVITVMEKNSFEVKCQYFGTDTVPLLNRWQRERDKPVCLWWVNGPVWPHLEFIVMVPHCSLRFSPSHCRVHPLAFINLYRLWEPADRGSGICCGALYTGHPPHPQWVHLSALSCFFFFFAHFRLARVTVTVTSNLLCLKVDGATAVSSRSPGTSISLQNKVFTLTFLTVFILIKF